MKAEELMIGDLVRVSKDVSIKKGTIVEIRAIDADREFHELKGCATCVPIDNPDGLSGGVWLDYLEPIPLNDEILQKNGFRRVGERWGLGDELNSYYFGNGQDVDIHLPTNSDKYMLVIRDHVSPDPDYQLILRLKYVHKLQHALKEYKYEKITIKL